MRGLLGCAKHDGIGGTRIKRSRHRFANRRRRAGHAAGEPGCEVQAEGTATNLSSPSLQVQQVDCYARSGLLLQRKQNQNKHLFAPPPRRFLNYRVGPRDAAHARQGTAPASLSEVRGQNLRRRHNNYGHQPIKAAAWVFDDAHGPIRGQRSPSRALRLKFQSKSAPLFLAFLLVGPVLLFTSLPEALTRRQEYCDRTAWPAPRTVILKAPPFQASNLAAVSRTDENVNTPRAQQSPEASLPVPPACKSTSDGEEGAASPWQQAEFCDDWLRDAVTQVGRPTLGQTCTVETAGVGEVDTPTLAPPHSRPRVDLPAPVASAQARHSPFLLKLSLPGSSKKVYEPALSPASVS